MKTRPCDWFNTKRMKPVYGIEVFAFGKWMKCAENGKPCLFDTEQERDAKRSEFRKLKAPLTAKPGAEGVK